jgi:hypothetical protein
MWKVSCLEGKKEQALASLGERSVHGTWLKKEVKLEVLHGLLKIKCTEASKCEYSSFPQ